MNADAFRRLAGHAPQCQPADTALALTTLWLGRLCNRMDYAAGFIFMRRMGSAALTSTGPVLNVLPLAVHIDARGDAGGHGDAPRRSVEKDAPPSAL